MKLLHLQGTAEFSLQALLPLYSTNHYHCHQQLKKNYAQFMFRVLMWSKNELWLSILCTPYHQISHRMSKPFYRHYNFCPDFDERLSLRVSLSTPTCITRTIHGNEPYPWTIYPFFIRREMGVCPHWSIDEGNTLDRSPVNQRANRDRMKQLTRAIYDLHLI